MGWDELGINLLRRLFSPETVEIRLKPKERFRGPVKILGINGSGRGASGSTAKMLDEFMDQAKKFGAEVETIHLAEKNMRFCDGCASEKDGCHFPCIHEDDDTNEILRAIIEADALVFATPNYWAGVSSRIQMLLEKMTALEENHYGIALEDGREPLLGKPSFLLCSQDGEGAAMVLGRLSWALNHIGIWVLPWGMVFKPNILNRPVVRLGMRAMNERKFEWIPNTIRAGARNLVLVAELFKRENYQWDDYKTIEPAC